MQRTLLVFGTVAGLIVSATLLVMMLIHRQNPGDFDNGELVGYASMLLSASMIPVAIESYRDRYLAGAISFKSAFLIGLGIALIASTFYAITWIILYKTVYPNFVQDYARYTTEKLKAEGKSAADLAKARQEMQAVLGYYNSWAGLIGITFIEIFPVMLIVVLISAWALKRKSTRLVS